MLRAIGISARREGRGVLDDLSLDIQAGELVVVEGERGAGKSTLLEIAAALRRPDSGELWIGGRNITGLQRASLPYVRRNVGYAGAALGFVPDATVAENLALALAARGSGPRAGRAVPRVLGALGLDALAARRASTLSAAEARLVALARALAGAPPLVIVDDPSAMVAPRDVEMALSVLFATSASGAAVLCASADGAFIGAAARNGARRMRVEAGQLLSGARPVGVAASSPPAARPGLSPWLEAAR